jgi:regulator of nonsense transcripts 1
LDNVTIRWDTGLNKKTIVWFPRPVSEAEFKINTGDEVIIRHPNPTLTTRNWFAVGVIIDIPQNLTSEVPVEIKPGFKCHTTTTIGYGIEFVWNSISYDRMRAAIDTLVLDNKCMSIQLLDLLMGNGDQHQESDFEPLNLKDVSAPNLPPLNHSQAHAVRSALQRPLTLIQGPPGTGKTVTSASIVYHLAQRGPVLVVASSNVAVDHLTEKIHQSGLRVVRITSKARETLDSSVSFLSLHIQARTVSKDSELDRLHKLKSEVGQLSQADENKYLKLQRKAEKLVLDSSQVICCTCVGAGDPRVLSRKFSSVLIDEATQATEPEALISLVHGVSQVIMVGDHRQLGPVIMNKACSKVGFDRSMFERLMQVGIRPIRLQVQYRMHPSLSEFPSNMFYDGSLQNGVTITERIRPELDFSWPNPNVPMFLLSCFGSEELASTGTSYLNRVEAATVEKIVTKLLKSSVHPSQIGIITPYQGQRAFIMQMMIMNGHMKKELYEAIEVASVDAFQGREKDYIILSCVRSNDHSSIGFVSDARRMNVALTRARYGLIVLGNPKVLSKNHLWNNLICHFKELQVLMEGNIGNLQPSPLHFSRSTHQHQSHSRGQSRTEEAINRHGRSAFTNDNDDSMSLHSFATDVFFNDNLSQLSQEDYEEDFSSSESDN